MIQLLQNLQRQLSSGFGLVLINGRNLGKELWILRGTLSAFGLGILLLVVMGYLFARPISIGLDTVDPGNRLDWSQIERAAQPLVERKIPLAVVVVSEGSDERVPVSERFNGTHLFSRFDPANPRPKAIGLYVSFEPRYSELVTGADWQTILDPPTLQQIRLEVLNPALRDGQLSDGVAQSLTAFEAKLMSVGFFQRWKGDIVRGAWIWGFTAMMVLIVAVTLWDFLQKPRRSLDLEGFSSVNSAQSALKRCTEKAVPPDILAGLQARYEALECRRYQLLQPFFLDREAIAQLKESYRRFEFELLSLIERIEWRKREFQARLDAVFKMEESLMKLEASRVADQSQETVTSQDIAALRDRLTHLTQQYEAIAPQLPDGEPTALKQHLEDLNSQYSAIHTTVNSLWRSLYPEAAKAKAEQEKETAKLYERLYPRSNSSETAKSYGSSSSNSNSSYDDYSNWQDASGGSINSDGGSW